jgi:hypothetical protein
MKDLPMLQGRLLLLENVLHFYSCTNLLLFCKLPVLTLKTKTGNEVGLSMFDCLSLFNL